MTYTRNGLRDDMKGYLSSDTGLTINLRETLLLEIRKWSSSLGGRSPGKTGQYLLSPGAYLYTVPFTLLNNIKQH